MDTEKILLYALQGLGGAFCTVLWFSYKTLLAKVEANTADLASYKVRIAEGYVTQTELAKAVETFNRALDGINTKLARIEDKLDNKQDKD